MSHQQQYELVYFPVKGRANMLRVMLADQGVAYKYTNVDPADWPIAKAKYPFGQLPLLIVNGTTQVAQSLTIARYLAREHGLLGSDSLEQAQVEMWVDQTLDVRTKLMTMVQTNYEAGLQPFLESLPGLLAPFEARLASAKHLVLDQLTLADYAAFDLLFYLQALKADCLEHQPTLKAFYASFGQRPGIRAYTESEEYRGLRTTRSPHLA